MALVTRAITLARNHWRAADRATTERPIRDATLSRPSSQDRSVRVRETNGDAGELRHGSSGCQVRLATWPVKRTSPVGRWRISAHGGGRRSVGRRETSTTVASAVRPTTMPNQMR
jgi:hypothetical protein